MKILYILFLNVVIFDTEQASKKFFPKSFLKKQKAYHVHIYRRWEWLLIDSGRWLYKITEWHLTPSTCFFFFELIFTFCTIVMWRYERIIDACSAYIRVITIIIFNAMINDEFSIISKCTRLGEFFIFFSLLLQ